jgi:hypothetical protein
MQKQVAGLVAWIVLGMLSTAFVPVPCSAADAERMLAHDVYFSLTDNSPAAKAKLTAACQKYLSGHPGTIWFAAGPLAAEFQRDVNDRDFDVALHLVFKNKAAHDQYATAERHLRFIEENKANWKKVRVFDSYLEASSHEGVMLGGDRPEKSKKPALPDPAAGFAGMIQGKIAQKFDGACTLTVEKVVKEWEHSKAKDSKSLLGKTVAVDARKGEKNVARFVKLLKVGEQVTLDVGHKGGEVLTILELSEDQRERVKTAAVEK